MRNTFGILIIVICLTVTVYAQINEASLNIPLKTEIEKIGELDQKYRIMMDSVAKKHGWDSKQMDELWMKQSELDSLNLLRVEEIIAKYGYPGKSLVGNESSTVFFVIQHSDSEIQEKYLPILKESADKGELSWSSLALLIDRIKTSKGEKQTYGSQLSVNYETNQYEFFPIEDEINVNKRRAEVGLCPLKKYAKYFGLKYKLPKK